MKPAALMVVAGLAALVVVILLSAVFYGGDIRGNASGTLAGDAASNGIFPTETEDREQELRAAARAQLTATPIFLAWKEALPWGKQTPITVTIASSSIAGLRERLSEGGEFRVGEADAKIGRRIRAELSGANVEIKPNQVVERDVTKLANVTIEWLVEPKRPGRTTLTARVWNGLQTETGETVWVEREPAFEKTVKVKIGLLDWLTWQMKNFQGLEWLLGGVAALIALWFSNRRRIKLWLRLRGKRPAAPAAANSDQAEPATTQDN